MEKEHILMEDFQFDLIGDFFRNIERQGPCDVRTTELALRFAGELPDNARIADIGCGTGGQTMTLAANLKGHITAIDLLPAFVSALREKVAQKGLNEQITVIEGSMESLPFSDNEIDLMYAEGSIYHIGYKRGINEWNRFIKPGGIIAVSEASWFTDDRPDEIQRFWDENYPEVDTIPNKVAQMQEAGYIPLAHYVMPEYTWWNYFNPIRDNYDAFLARHNNSPEAQMMIRHFEDEIALYEKYQQYYGYVFYIGQKPE